MCVTARRPAGPPAGKVFLSLVTALGAAPALDPYIMSAAYIKFMCVTDHRPAGEKQFLTLVTALDAAVYCTPAGGHHEAKLLDMY